MERSIKELWGLMVKLNILSEIQLCTNVNFSTTTFSSFSRVTNFFRGALQPHLEGASPDLPPAPDDEPEPGFEVISCVSIHVVAFALAATVGAGPRLPRLGF